MIWHYAEFRYAECHVLFTIMLNVIMLSVDRLNIFTMGAIMLSVMGPYVLYATCAKAISVTQH